MTEHLPREICSAGPAIEQMTEWLEDWGEDVSDTRMMGSGDDMEHGDMGSDTDGNSGVMSQEDMDELGQPPLRHW